MPKKIKKKISQATPSPIDIGSDEQETSNKGFYNQQTPRIKDLPEEIPLKDIEQTIQKSWADIVYPFTKRLNLYVVISLIIYISAITTGHLSNWKEFGFVSLAILICFSISFLFFLKNKFK